MARPRQVNQGTAKQKVNDAVNKFKEAQDSLNDFIADNEDFFDTFRELVRIHNADMLDAKSLIRDLKCEGTTNFGPFKYVPTTKTVYDINLLDPLIARIPGVLEVNKTKVDALVKAGKISPDEVKDAKKKIAGSCRIDGPRKVVL